MSVIYQSLLDPVGMQQTGYPAGYNAGFAPRTFGALPMPPSTAGRMGPTTAAAATMARPAPATMPWGARAYDGGVTMTAQPSQKQPGVMPWGAMALPNGVNLTAPTQQAKKDPYGLSGQTIGHGLIGLGASMMQAAAPSTDPRALSFGGALGAGLQGMYAGLNQGMQLDEYRRQRRERDRQKKGLQKLAERYGFDADIADSGVLPDLLSAQIAAGSKVQYTPMTGQQLVDAGVVPSVSPEDKDRIFQYGSDGSVKGVGSRGQTINVNAGNKLQEADIGTWTEMNSQNRQILSLFPQIDTALDVLLNSNLQTGQWQQATLPIRQFVADLTGVEVDNVTEQETYRAISSYITPRMRVSGSGSSSDKDMELFSRSFGELGQSELGNYISAYTLKNAAQSNARMLAEEREMIERGISYSERMARLSQIDRGIYARPQTAEEITALPRGTVYIHPQLRKLRVAGWNKRGQ